MKWLWFYWKRFVYAGSYCIFLCKQFSVVCTFNELITLTGVYICFPSVCQDSSHFFLLLALMLQRWIELEHYSLETVRSPFSSIAQIFLYSWRGDMLLCTVALVECSGKKNAWKTSFLIGFSFYKYDKFLGESLKNWNLFTLPSKTGTSERCKTRNVCKFISKL